MNITDTHSHYTDERFASEYPGGADALLSELFASGVGPVINVAVSSENSAEVIAQAARYPLMYAAVGVHPTELGGERSPEDSVALLRSLIAERERNKIVAIGEIGLDYHWDITDREEQKRYFRAQLELARECGLPVCIHDRDAHGDLFEIILEYPGVRGVMHSFSGSRELAAEYLRRGWYISFSGVVTFKNAPRVREVAASVPADRLLLETDCPYLAPEPCRGKLNRSDYIAYTAAALGALHGMSAEEICLQCEENMYNLFGIGRKNA